ncbi:MAG: GntR family transcriptional regulator [Chloroflexota bacterium]
MITRNQSLADQVHKEILNWIQANQADNARVTLPSETDLSDLFSTSRATVREALAQLERERLVIRRQGAGTYVSPAFHKLSNTINELNDPLILIGRNGTSATIGTLNLNLVPVDADSARNLEIKTGDSAVQLRILYLLDGEPAAGLEALIPAFEFYTSNPNLPPFSGLIRFAFEVSGRTATHSIATLRAVSASASLAGLLQVPTGQPLMSMEELYLTELGGPAFHSTLSILSNKVELDMLRNSDQSDHQIAIW